MEKRGYIEEGTRPTTITLDYGALKECMKDAIKEALLYERKRREAAIKNYAIAMIGCGLLFLFAEPLGVNQGQVFALVVLAGTQIVFTLWALTRWI